MTNKHLLKLSIPMHLLLCVSFIVIDFTMLHLFGILVLWTLIGGFGVAVGYHRLFAHKSFETYKPIEKILAYLGLLSCDGSVPFWVALHRGYHHPYSDTDKDPHTPKKGIFYSFVLWQFYISESSVKLVYARDCLRDKYLMFLHHHQYKIFWLTFLVLFLISPVFALGVFVPASLLSHHQDNLVNVLGHLRFLSYRNHATPDNSQNDFITGLLVWGQGWHNNHHNNAGKSNFGGERWWEFDSAHQLLIPLIKKR